MVAEENFIYMDKDGIDANLKCGICEKPLVNPVSVSPSCSQSFCRRCVQINYAAHANGCPQCQGKPLSTGDLKSEGQVVNRMLGSLLVECSCCSEQNIKRGDFARHSKEICPKRMVTCSARDVQCPWTGPADQSDQHSGTCPYQQLRALLTQLLGDQQDLGRLRHAYQTLTNQFKQQQADLEQMKNSNQILNERVKHLEPFEKQYNEQLTANTKLTGEKTVLIEQKAGLEQKLKLVDEQLQKAQADLGQLKEQINPLEALRTAHEQLKADYQAEKQQCEQYQMELKNLQESSEEKTKQLNDQNQILSERMSQLEALKTECEQVKSENQLLQEQADRYQMELTDLQPFLQEQTHQLNAFASLPQQIDTLIQENQHLTQQLQEFDTMKKEHRKLHGYYQQLASEKEKLQEQLAHFHRVQAEKEHLVQQVIECQKRDERSALRIKRLQVKLSKPVCSHDYFRGEKNGYRNEQLEELIGKCQQGSLINLNGETLTDDDMNIIIHQSLVNPRFQSILLWNNHLTEPSLTRLFSSFSYNKLLRELSISKNHLSDRSMEHLAEALSFNNCTLARLTLSSNQITDEGVGYLSIMLRSNDTLLALGLQENQISDQSMECLCEALQFYNQVIEEICLYGNQSITDASVHFIAKAVAESPSLKTLWVWDCGFSEQAKHTLEQSSQNKAPFDLKM